MLYPARSRLTPSNGDSLPRGERKASLYTATSVFAVPVSSARVPLAKNSVSVGQRDHCGKFLSFQFSVTVPKRVLPGQAAPADWNTKPWMNGWEIPAAHSLLSSSL